MMQIVTKFFALTKAYKLYIIATLVFAGAIAGYSVWQSDSTAEVESFSVVQAVGRGKVSSGIETTGEIVAAQKLDLDVYKQMSRIDVVNIQNGSHVEEGDVLISFDKSDASVEARSAAVSKAEAELNLETAREDVGDQNTEIRTLENQIAGYKKSIEDARQDFLNESLEINPVSNSTMNKTRPTISGRYVQEGGQYRVLVAEAELNDRYKIESSLIYKVFDSSGLISEHELIYGIATPIADTGLKITFTSAMNPETSDKWEMLVPNTEVSTYAESKADYEKTVRDLEVSLANAEQDLVDLKQTDSSAYRNLDVEKAKLSLSEAQQRLSENYEAIKERDIIAPFAGSVQDMENVVVGATPTGGTEDSISLGTLISDEYLATFTLDAADAAKVSVGQKVSVTVTSYANQPQFEATITEISSLPAEGGVAQYDVSAKLDYDAKTAETVLREGMLADIVVVQEEKADALRVPTSAITYEEGRPTVQVVDMLTEEQQQQFDQMGIVRTVDTALATYPVTVELGIEGRYYTEILSGLEEGDLILTTATTLETSESTVNTGFGPPAGGAVRIQNGGNGGGTNGGAGGGG